MKNLCALKAFGVAALVMLAIPASAAEVVDRIVAVIENEIITLRELEQRALPFLEKVSAIADENKRKRQRGEVLQKVLDIQIGEKMVDLELKLASTFLFNCNYCLLSAMINRDLTEFYQFTFMTF